MQNTGCTEQRERQNPEGEKKKNIHGSNKAPICQILYSQD